MVQRSTVLSGHSRGFGLFLLFVIVVALSGCGGGGGGGGTFDPGLALALEGSATGSVNQSNAAGATFDVTVADGTESGSVFTVTVADSAGATAEGSATFTAAELSTLSVGPIDLTSLADGMLTVSLTVTPPGGNPQSSTANLALNKDTIAPATPLSVALVDALNPVWPTPAGTINLQNVAQSVVSVQFGAGSVATDSAQVVVSDGLGANQTGMLVTAPSGAGATTETFDLTTLADGPITFTVSVTDDAGNVSTTTGTATKDTVVATPITAFVPGGANNPVNVINAQTASAADIVVELPNEDTQPTDSVFVTVAGTVTTPTLMAPLGGGSLTFSAVDVSALADGMPTLQVTVVDDRGNAVVFMGTAPVLDTVVGAVQAISIPSLAYAGGATNPSGVVNAVSQSAVTINVPIDSNVAGGDTVSLMLFDGAQTFTASMIVAQGTTGQVSFVGLDLSGLLDGTLAATVSHEDAAGNSSSGAAGTAAKDTVAPVAPTSAAVAAGGTNQANQINSSNASLVFVDVVWHPSMMGDELGSVFFTDSTGAQVLPGGPLPVPAGGGAQQVGPFDLTGLANGVIAVVVVVEDPSRNGTLFNGTSAVLNQSGPPGPMAAQVAATVMNAAGVINVASASSVAVTVNFGGASLATHEAVVTLSDGANSVSSAALAAPNGTGQLTFLGLNASGLSDGPIIVSVLVTDTLTLASTPFVGTSAIKDTTPPAAPTLAAVAGQLGYGNSTINSITAASVLVAVTLPASYVGGEPVVVTLSDGVTTTTPVMVTALAGGGGLVTSGIDASALSDGPISVGIQTTDLSGNQGTFAGTMATKDTVAPAAPTFLGVAASPTNAQHLINISNVTTAVLDVTFDGSMIGSEQVSVTLTSSGGGAVTFAGMTPPPGGGATQIGPFDLSPLSVGTVSIALTLTDGFGNPAVFTGTPATLFLAAPALPDTVVVAAGAANPAGFVNASSVATVQVDLTWSANAVTTDMVQLSITDGVTSVSAGPLPAPNGSGTLSFLGVNLTGLNEGPLTVNVLLTSMSMTTSMTSAMATKDTVAPSSPGAAGVLNSSLNPLNFINATTAAAAVVSVLGDASYDGTERLDVVLTDGLSSVSGFATAGTGASISMIGGLGASGLSDGPIAVNVTVTDLAGNTTSFLGTAATKDVVAPVAPMSLRVAAGPGNAIDLINTSNEAAVMVDVVFDASMQGTESATLTFDSNGGGGPVVSGAFTTTLGGGAAVLGGVDVTALIDGLVSVNLALTDLAGNSTQFAGMSAIKDTGVLNEPSWGRIAAGISNSAHVINTNNVATTVVEVAFTTGDPGDQVSVEVSDGVTTMTLGPLAAPNGFGVLSFGPVSTALLVDGPITINILVTDIAANTVAFPGTSAIKDTVDLVILSARIAPTINNPANFINQDSQSTVTVEVTLDANYDGSEQLLVVLGDGVTNLPSAILTPPAGGGVVLVSGLNMSSLNDGPINTVIWVSDQAGNLTNLAGAPAQKDVIDPIAPTNLIIAVGASNGQGIINSSNVTAFQASIDWDATMAGDELAEFSIASTGGGTFLQGGLAVPGGGGTQLVGPFSAATLMDGNLTLSMLLTDPAGNASMVTGSAVLDTSAPGGPASASVNAGASNAINVINASSVGATSVDVAFLLGDPTDMVRVTLTDGGATVDLGSQAAPNGVGTLTFGPMSTAALADGSITVSVEVTDMTGNMTPFAGAAALKDVLAPSAPSSAHVIAGPANTVDFISAASVSNVTIEVVENADWVNTDQVTVTLADGGLGSASGGPTAPAGGSATMTFVGLDASALLEQAGITLTVDVVDAAGNTASYPGTPCEKDVTAPAAPSVLAIAAGVSNASNVINASNVSAYSVDVTWDASMTGDEIGSLTIVSLGGGNVTQGGLVIPSSGGAQVLGPFNASVLLDGSLSLIMTLTDPAGNTSNFLGMADLDVTVPAMPTLAQVSPGANNALNFINLLSVGSTAVQVDFGAGSEATDSVEVILSDGASSVSLGTQAGPAGAGMVSFGPIGLAALLDGPITVTVEITDPFDNITTFVGTPATKDVVAPLVPTDAKVAATPSNAVHFITLASEASVVIEVAEDAGWTVNDAVTVTLTDSLMATAVSGPLAPSGLAGTLTFSGINAGGLLEESGITLTGEIVDAAGNVTSFTGTPCEKDVTPPGDVTAFAVAAGMGNGSNLINSSNASAVTFDVTYGAPLSGVEQGEITAMSSGGGTVGVVANAISAGTTTAGPFDLSSLGDGAVSFTVVTRDVAGNPSTVTFNGTAATKDVVVALPLSAGVVAGGGNAAHQINSTNVGAVQVDVVLPAEALTTDAVTVTLSDGVAMIVGGPLNPAVDGASTLSFPGLDLTTLLDGSITLSVNIVDVVGNTGTSSGTSATKDLVVPDPATSANVVAGSNNAINVINQFNSGTVIVEVGLPASSQVNETTTVTLRDTNPTDVVSVGKAGIPGGGTLSFTLDSATLLDGPIAVLVETVDGGGNSASFTGTAAIRDTVGPDVTGVFLGSSATNARFEVNASNASAVDVDVSLGGGTLTTDSVTVTFADGVNPSVTSATSNPVSNGMGTLTISGIDVTSLDDSGLSLSASVVDANGNIATTGVQLVAKRSAGASRFGYVANGADDTVSTYTLDPTSGRMAVVGYANTGGAPSAVAVDPRGRYVFVANQADDTISVFSRSGTGLTLLETQAVAGVGPRFLSVDPLGRQLVIVTNDDSLYALPIDPMTGLGSGPVIAVGFPALRGMSMHPSGRFFLVTAINGVTPVVEAWELDASGSTTGGRAVTAASATATAIVAAPSGNFVYAVDPTNGNLEVFAFDQDGISLSSIATTVVGANPREIVFAPSGDFAYVANEGDGTISQFAVDSMTGLLSPLTPPAAACGTNPVDLAMTRDGNYLHVIHGSGEVWTFSVAGSGLLTFESAAPTMGTPTGIDLLDAPASTGWNLEWILTGNEGSADVSTLDLDDATGVPTATGSPVSVGNSTLSIAVSPFLDYVYVTSAFGGTGDGAINGFSFDVGSGTLTPVPTGTLSLTAPATPVSAFMSGAGDFLFVPYSAANEVNTFAVGNSGDLTQQVGASFPLATGGLIDQVLLHPNGKFAYLRPFGGSDIVVLEIDPVTGSLTNVQTAMVSSTSRMAFHPTGRFFFAVEGGGPAEVRTVAVDPSGMISGSTVNAVAMNPVDVVVHPSGDFAYVVHGILGVVQAYAVNPATGALAAVGAAVAAGGSPSAVAVSPRGDYLYVADYNLGGASDVSTFDIDVNTGLLTPSTTPTSSVGGDGTRRLKVIATFQ